jgi:hypothetical protein
MAYIGQDWPDIDPAVIRPYTYDFTLRLAPGDVIASVTWDLSVAPAPFYSGSDSASNTKLATFSNTNVLTTAWLSNALPGVRYRLTATIITNLGMKDDLFSYIKCNPIV